MPIIKARSSSIISSVDLRGTPTVATASSGASTTQIASTAFVSNAVAELVASSPAALDTLRELAAALGDDANFATTVTTALATKLELAGGTMTGSLYLFQDPQSDAEAATKKYVDDSVSAITINSTDDVPEGVLNLYFTEDRVRASISLSSDNTDVLAYNAATGAFTFAWPTSDGLVEGVNNLFYTTTRVRNDISLASDDQDILSYSSTTGGFTFNTPNTDKISEGASNLYFTTARARNTLSAGSNISYDAATGIISSTSAVESVNGLQGAVVLDTDLIDEGTTNLYFTNTRARAAVSLTSSDTNTLSYNGTTGEFTYVKPDSDGIAEGSTNLFYTDERARLAISVTGDLTYNNTTGVLGFSLGNHDTDDLAEGLTNLYFTDARARGAVSLTTDDADILSYNGTTGAFTYATPDTDKIAEGTGNLYFTDARARAAISVTGWQISYNSGTGVITMATPTTSDVTEGTNLYFTDARARTAVSLTSSNTSVLSYNNETGVFTFNLAAQTSDDVAEGSTNLYYTDERVDDRVSNLLVAGDGITLSYDDPAGTLTIDSYADTDGLSEGSTNLYFTQARARGAVSVTDAGGDGSLSYDSATGVITYTGPSAAEVRAHFSATTSTGVTLTDGVIALASIPNSSLTNSSVTINGSSLALGGSLTLGTDDVAEGTSNLYFTDARARSAISLTTDNTDALSYNSTTGAFTFDLSSVNSDEITEGATNLYFTASRVRQQISVSDLGGDGSLSYDNTTGVISYTGPSAAEVRAHFTAGTGIAITDGSIATSAVPNASLVNSDVTFNGITVSLGGSGTLDTDDIGEGLTNQYYTDARARAAVSASGDISYNSTTGVFSFSESVNSVNGATGVVVLDTDDVAEGTTNLYYTDARAQAAITGGTGVDVTGGVVSIGQAVGTTDDVTFNDVTVGGNLTVNGTLTTINSTDLTVTDKNITIADGAADAAAANGAGITVDGANATITYASGTDTWNFNKTVVGTFEGNVTGDVTGNLTGDVTGTVSDISNHSTTDLSEGTNLYFTDARARSAISLTTDNTDALSYNSSTGAFTFDLSSVNSDEITEGATNLYFTASRVRQQISVSDLGGDGSLSYDNTTGVISYTGPSAAEVRAHFAAGTGITITDGTIATSAVPNASLANSDVTFNGVTVALGGTGTLDSDDIGEGLTNLYFTDARARGAVSASGDITYNSTTGVFSFSMGDYSTDDITEGATNLYYTDARAQAAISVTDAGGDGSLSYDNTTGVITYTGPSATEVRAHFSATTSTGVTLTDGVIALASIPNSSLTNSSVTVNGTAIALGGSATFTTSDIAEGTNLYFTDARARSAISLTSSDTSIMSYDSTTGEFTFNFAGSTTDGVAEGVNNLYYTDERVDDRVAALFVAGDNIALTYDDAAGTFTIDGPTTTTEITEGTNLYYTDARVRAAVSLTTNDSGVMSYDSATGAFTFDSTGLNTDEITEGTTNLYYTDARARGAVSVSGDLTYNSGTGVIGFSLSNHTTDDLAEGTTNLYFTNARVHSAISLTTDNTDAMSYDAATGAFTFSLATVDTDEIAEGATNLYFTTARARGAVSVTGSATYDAATGIIDVTGDVSSVNGQTGVVVLDTDNIDEGSANLYFTDARARSALTVTSDDSNVLSYNTATGVLTYAKPDTDAIAEGAVNLYYTEARVDARIAAASVFDLSDVDSGTMTDGYTLVWSGATNSFVPQNISVNATTLNFTGDGSTASFNTQVEISSIEDTQVFINGLVQAPTYSYTLSTVAGETSIVFDTAPETNDYIMVRVISSSQLTAGGVLNESSTIDGGTY